ncbi:MAG: hypothetical protein CMH78_07190 [Nitrospinae bacterium]|nr:hypothetical protein [Nitrospinota bacterium]
MSNIKLIQSRKIWEKKKRFTPAKKKDIGHRLTQINTDVKDKAKEEKRKDGFHAARTGKRRGQEGAKDTEKRYSVG